MKNLPPINPNYAGLAILLTLLIFYTLPGLPVAAQVAIVVGDLLLVADWSRFD